MTRCVCLLSICISGILFTSASAQYRVLDRLGLERAWTTSAPIDRRFNELASIGISVNHDPSQAISVFEVNYDGGQTRIGQLDIGRDGRVLGLEEASRLAEKEMIRKKSLGKNPKLVTQKVSPVMILVTSTTGMVQALDAETGREIWSVSIGNSNRPTSGAGANSRFVAVINGSSLFVLTREDGQVIMERELIHSPMVLPGGRVMAPTMGDGWVFCPCLKGTVQAFNVNDFKVSPWFYTSRGELTGPPTVSAKHVAWTTQDGRMFAGNAVNPEVLFRLETNAPIRGSVAYSAPGRLFVAGANGYVFALDERTESVTWEVSTGQSVNDSPVAIGEDLFVVSDEQNLICLSAADGIQRWTASGVHGFAGASASRVYGTDVYGRLLVLNRTRGTRIASPIDLGTNRVLSNAETDRIYLASTSGRILCIKETTSRLATIHHQPEVDAKTEITKKRGTTRAETAKSESFDSESSPLDGADDESFGFDDAPADVNMDDQGDAPTENGPAIDDEDPFDFGDDSGMDEADGFGDSEEGF